ncbi:MAG: hypothetical protein JSV03_10885, partial [Planctomycetota bacterium]
TRARQGPDDPRGERAAPGIPSGSLEPAGRRADAEGRPGDAPHAGWGYRHPGRVRTDFRAGEPADPPARTTG